MFVVIIVGMCIALLNEPTAVNQTGQSDTPTNVFGVTDPDQWWDTPDGQDAWDRISKGELSVKDMEFIFGEMGEGKSYNEARERIGHGIARLRRYADQPTRSYESFLEEDWKPVTKEWLETQKKRAGRTGWVGAVPIGMGDIFISSVRAVSEAVPEIIAGRESSGQAFGVLAIVLLMAWVTRRSAKIIVRAERSVIAPFKDGKRNSTTE